MIKQYRQNTPRIPTKTAEAPQKRLYRGIRESVVLDLKDATFYNTLTGNNVSMRMNFVTGFMEDCESATKATA